MRGRPTHQHPGRVGVGAAPISSSRWMASGRSSNVSWVESAQLIPLHRHGEVVAHAKVSTEDFDRLNKHRWSLTRDGYACRWVREDGRTRAISIHREVLGLSPDDPRWGDHKEGDKLDNRRSELRAVTPRQNRRNSRSTSKTGVKGVSLHSCGQYEARINIGLFDTIEEATTAVIAATEWREQESWRGK